MAWEQSAWSLTEGDIAAFSRSLDRPLPAAFIDHYLLVSNGGWFPDGVESPLGVHGFHPITYGSLSIERLIEDMGLRQRGEVPFAYDAGGNQFLLVLATGQVDRWFVDGGRREPTGLSIAEFLDQCRADLAPAAAHRPSEQELADAVVAATRTAVTELFQRYPTHRFYYLSLITTGEVHPPCLSAWSHEALHAVGDDPDLRWSYADSPFNLFGAQHFAKVRRLCEGRGADTDAEADLRLRAMESAMSRLDREGLFGRGAARDGVVVNVEVMPPDFTNTERALRLNPPQALTGWLAEAAADPD
ncbi:hypothetical protein GCM10010399_40130 [Dactylosporangium fulvum]|uniref:DUF4303 domain-containing protein n=1 Tax=Dactylosporangium fulvum TaxID=53359 RepID=A0ABY5VZ77_9ACTN|nr:DUF4303 domain-containing protein [Dactylosporangium fulvum]UWP83012.1 DUF4303 domain-containing protein [Dactylosporangium fulvum]